MFKKRSARKPVVVGLDLDAGHAAAVEVLPDGPLTIRRCALVALRPGVLRDGEVTDPEALTETLRALFAEHELPTRVRIGVANQRIVVRTMDLEPLLDDAALDAAVRAQAADHIPMPMEEAVVDHRSLGVVSTPEGPRTRVVIVAVRREVVQRLAECATAAGLTIEGIDLSAFAMVRAVGEGGPHARLYLNVAGLTNVAVANESGVLYARASSGGLEGLALKLAERRALTLEHAHQWLMHVGLTTPLDEIEGDPQLVAATRQVLDEGLHEIADAVRGSIEYFRMQADAVPVDDGVLTGPATAIPGFADALGERLYMPLTSAAFVPAVDGQPGVEAARLTVAAGLAVEEREVRAA